MNLFRKILWLTAVLAWISAVPLPRKSRKISRKLIRNLDPIRRQKEDSSPSELNNHTDEILSPTDRNNNSKSSVLLDYMFGDSNTTDDTLLYDYELLDYIIDLDLFNFEISGNEEFRRIPAPVNVKTIKTELSKSNIRRKTTVQKTTKKIVPTTPKPSKVTPASASSKRISHRQGKNIANFSKPILDFESRAKVHKKVNKDELFTVPESKFIRRFRYTTPISPTRISDYLRNTNKQSQGTNNPATKRYNRRKNVSKTTINKLQSLNKCKPEQLPLALKLHKRFQNKNIHLKVRLNKNKPLNMTQDSEYELSSEQPTSTNDKLKEKNNDRKDQREKKLYKLLESHASIPTSSQSTSDISNNKEVTDSPMSLLDKNVTKFPPQILKNKRTLHNLLKQSSSTTIKVPVYSTEDLRHVQILTENEDKKLKGPQESKNYSDIAQMSGMESSIHPVHTELPVNMMNTNATVHGNETLLHPDVNNTKSININKSNSKSLMKEPSLSLVKQLGVNPRGVNPHGHQPFGKNPEGEAPFGILPQGLNPSGNYTTVKTKVPTILNGSSVTNTSKEETIVTSSISQNAEERYHVQVKKPDGSINGDYVVLDPMTGNLNGVRYEAIDGADQDLIQKALLSFLSLDPRLDPKTKLK